MKSRKYREDVSVTWSVVLNSVENQIARNEISFKSKAARVNHELSHKTVDDKIVDYYTQSALRFCEEVFKWYDALCSLRQFLDMKPRSPKQLNIQQCYDFYRQHVDEREKEMQA